MGAGDPDTQAIVTRVRSAITTDAPQSARLDLHPYLHWTLPDGARVRGRTRVLTMLAARPGGIAEPADVELRDGQVYRWAEPGDR